MKILFSAIIFIFATTVYGIANAETPGERYIEHAEIIINLERTDGTENAHGYLLAKPCENCTQTRIEVNEHTEIFLNGKPTKLDALALKIDWQGMVFFNSGSPAIATRLMLQ